MRLDVVTGVEAAADHDCVADVHRRAFGAEGEVVAQLVDRLRATFGPQGALSLVARDEGAVVGHVLLTPALLDAPRRLVTVQVLSPLGVLPQVQRRGVGTLLVRHALQVAQARSAPVVFLEGDPAYYRRFGFEPGGELGFRRPSLRIPRPAFQALRLPSYRPWMTGTLVYSQPFWDLDVVGLRGADAAQRPPPPDGSVAP